MNWRDNKMRGPRPRWDELMGTMVVADLERSDTVAREPSTRDKTIVIPTLTL